MIGRLTGTTCLTDLGTEGKCRRSSSASYRMNPTLSPGEDIYVLGNQPFNSQKMLSWTRVTRHPHVVRWYRSRFGVGMLGVRGAGSALKTRIGLSIVV